MAYQRIANGNYQQEQYVRWPDARGQVAGRFHDRYGEPAPRFVFAHTDIQQHRNNESIAANRVRYFRQHIPSGDLYDRVKTGGPCLVRTKCYLIFLAAIPYALGMMVANVVAAAVHFLIVLSHFFVLIPGTEAVTGHTVLSDLTIVLLSPLFCAALMAGGAIGLVSQDTGMRIIDRVETAWHRNATYRDDLRYSDDAEGWFELFSRPFFLAECLLKRGNAGDTIMVGDQQMPKYELIANV